MRYKEIIEYNIIPDSDFNFDNISPESDIVLGTIPYQKNNIKTLNIYKAEDDKSLTFFIGHDVNNLVGYLGLVKRGNDYYTALKAYTSEPKQGLISTLIIWVLDNWNAKIISDTQLTRSGEKLWKKLISQYGDRIKIINTETGDEFSITDTNAIHPSKDNGMGELSDKNPNGQRWFYLMECMNLNHTGLNLPKFGSRNYSNITYKIFGDDWD